MSESETRPDGGSGRRDGRAPSRGQSLARWVIVAASILAIDGAVILWIAAARSLIADVGAGFHNHGYYSMYDGSFVDVAHDPITGTSKRTVTHPATAAGLCRVWWPAVPAGLLTLSGLVFGSTSGGRRYVADFPLPRVTTVRLMIAVAILGTEAGLALRRLGPGGFGAILFPRWERWDLTPTPSQLDQFLIRGFVLLVVGVVLLVRFVRRRLSRDPAAAAYRAS